ncbi:MAG: LysR family transcriptional regulator, glycine cleavage system transcriptional activator [Gammaproteobacteria bacterium]|nr:LysR family transcriptional regulator, glycine cleavage system transcriptional activator [Gammaproteobacteria bacterium]
MPSAYDRLPLGSLRVFEAVAAHLSFSAAADALNVTPAAVSQQIKTLEAYIQVPLFRRSGRRVEITDEGLELLPAVRSGLEKLESALQQMKHHRRAGPLQITLLSSFLQIWLLPRLRSFRRKYPDIELRFHTSRDLVDFSRSTNHIAIRFGRGNYPNVHSEKLLDDWLVPVASPELIKQYGMLERGTSLSEYPLLESADEPWRVWAQVAEEAAWHSRSPSIEDSVGLLTAAEEGLGYALARWTLVTRSLQKGSLKIAGTGAVPYSSAYHFVCPKSFLALPKVAQFRDWIFAAAAAFPGPPGRDD